METTIFDAYCDDLSFLATDIRNNLNVMKSGEASDALCTTISTVLDQATDTIKQAEVEARSFPSAERRVLNDKIKVYRDKFQDLKSEYDNELFQMKKSKLVGKSGEDRGRMLDVEEKYVCVMHIYSKYDVYIIYVFLLVL
jgi:hypothetical protein